MSGWTLYDKLREFDFDGGQHYVFGCSYDLRDEDDVELLDNDSADAASCVESLGLSYDITAGHYSTVVDGDRITDAVNVVWEFWKND